MKTIIASALAIAMASSPADSNSAEYTFQTSMVSIPKGQSIVLNRDEVVEVDVFQIDGEIKLEGRSFRVDASTLIVGKNGLISGYSKENVPNPPPNRSPFASPAAPGTDAPRQFSNNIWYIGGSAGQGTTGANGQDGDPGNPGNPRPGGLVLVAETIQIEGSIHLIGQTGSVGQAGQNGQDGGVGGKGMDAYCDEGNTSTACYSGGKTSGVGGLGGFGGSGGPGGPGGAAAPLVLITSSNSKPPLERVSSLPGEGGERGPSGNPGRSGGAGGPGMSCSATAHWGSFFGACSANGGGVTTKIAVDNRPPPVYPTGKAQNGGAATDWGQYPAVASLLAKGLKPQNGALSLHIPLVEEVKSTRRFALRVELVGRLATTILRLRDNYLSAPVGDRNAIQQQFQVELLPVISRVAALVGVEDISDLLGPDSAEPFSDRANATIPILRDRFLSERENLLNACRAIRQRVKSRLGEGGIGYFQRSLAWCSASQLTWLPFVPGQQKIVFTSPQAVVSAQFLPFFAVDAEQTSIASKSANGTAVIRASRDRVGNSQRLTPALLRAFQSRPAPAGRYVFSLARSGDVLEDILALDRGAAFIKAISP